MTLEETAIAVSGAITKMEDVGLMSHVEETQQIKRVIDALAKSNPNGFGGSLPIFESAGPTMPMAIGFILGRYSKELS